MIRNITPLLLFLLIFSCRGKIQQVNEVPNKDTALKILIWGLPDRDQQIAMDAVAKTYGFEYRRIAGCVISKNLYDSAIKVNEKSNKILRAKFGNDWKIEIDRRVSEIMDAISPARLHSDSSTVGVTGADGKLKRERVINKKKGIVKIVYDCCTAEDSCEPKPPLVNK